MTADDANRLLALVMDCSRGVRSPLELMDAVRALGYVACLTTGLGDGNLWTCDIELPYWEVPLSGTGGDASAAARSAVCKLVQFCRPAAAPA